MRLHPEDERRAARVLAVFNEIRKWAPGMTSEVAAQLTRAVFQAEANERVDVDLDPRFAEPKL